MVDFDQFKSYVSKLRTDGIGPDGIITKVERLILTLKYLKRQKQSSAIPLEQRIGEALHRLDQWHKAIGREKSTRQIAKAIIEASETDPDQVISQVKPILEYLITSEFNTNHMTADKHTNYIT